MAGLPLTFSGFYHEAGDGMSPNTPAKNAEIAKKNQGLPYDKVKAGEGSTLDLLSDDAMSWLQGLFVSNGQENQANREYNAREAQLNRDFQMDMSNTAYQRAVADMKKAGLNPALLFSGGHSASSSTPTGSQASYNVGGGDTASDMISSIGFVIGALASVLGGVSSVFKILPSKAVNKIGF